MAKETRPFDGHLDSRDPRGLLTAAAGCDWPTIPPYRVFLGSGNADGIWEFLQDAGLLYEMDLATDTHDYVKYNMIRAGGGVTESYIEREWSDQNEKINWWVSIWTIDCYFSVQIYVAQNPGKCNVDIPLYNGECMEENGHWGDQLTIYQVQFDKEYPENWTPPP